MLTLIFVKLCLYLILQVSPIFANIQPEFVPKEDELILKVEESPSKSGLVGSVLHRFKGTDWDGDSLQFTLVGEPQGLEAFKVEKVSKTEANLVLKKDLDREVVSEYVLDCLLVDGRTKKPAIQSVLVIVVDVNDNDPQFENFNKTLSIPENSDVPLIISTYLATDPDEGPNGEVDYILRTTEDDKLIFNLTSREEDDEVTLSLISPLDFEKKKEHIIQIVAFDNPTNESGGGPSRKTVINVTIQVLDLNDEGPIFLNRSSRITEISEETPLYSEVGRVKAVDGDVGLNSTINYELLNHKHKFSVDRVTGVIKTMYKFSRNRQTSGIYRLRIRASEVNSAGSGIPQQSGGVKFVDTEVIFNVTEVWGSPHFTNESYLGQVSENSPKGYPVIMKKGFVTEVCDNDMGGRDLVKLRVEGDDRGSFEVTPEEGFGVFSFQILVKNSSKLDYELIKEIGFYLIAEDSAGNKTRTLVTVSIIDQNDNKPVFQNSTYLALIPENPKFGLVVTSVKAMDKDSGVFGVEGLRYVKLRGLGEHELQLNEMSGEIKVIGKDMRHSVFDREKHPQIYLSVEVRDDLGQGNSDTALVVVQLDDQNDNTPQFGQSFYSTELFENQQDISLPIKISSFDADQPKTKNSEVRYSLLSSSYSDHLKIDPITGILFVKKSFDYEQIQSKISSSPSSPSKPINFTIQASDLGEIPLSSQVNLTLYILDKNDCKPKFTKLNYSVIVREDLGANQEILRVKAIDKDVSPEFNQVIYKLKGQSIFNVNSKTGAITLQNGFNLDWNTHPEYTVAVSCIDEMGLNCEEDGVVKMTVLDVNNKPPVFKFPTSGESFESNICEIGSGDGGSTNRSLGYYTATVAENTPKGSVVTMVMASDPDNMKSLRYSINYKSNTTKFSKNGKQVKIENFKNHLAIDPLTGVITTTSVPFDYETMDHVKVQIVVEDVLGQINTPQKAYAWLVIEILNVVDVKPKFMQSRYTAVVKENSPVGTEVVTVKAVAEAEIEYTIDGISGGKKVFPFEVDGVKGIVRVAGVVDRETKDWYNFSVKASQNKIFSVVPVSIRIEDENDNPPVFIDEIAPDISIDENIPLGTIVSYVTAADKDSGNYGAVKYILEDTSGTFTIDPKTGVISTTAHIDREKRDSYELLIKCIDNPNFTNNSDKSNVVTKVIRVHVKDDNDNPPEFNFLSGKGKGEEISSNSSEYIVTENLPVDFSILSFTLTDVDQKDTPNTEIKVVAKDDLIPPLFKLVQRNKTAINGSNVTLWSLFPARSFYDMEGNYTVNLIAEDNGDPPNKVVEAVSIIIKEVSDINNPVIQSLKFDQPLFTAVITPGSSQRELLQVVLSSEYPNYKYIINFSLVHVFPQTCDRNLFAIHPTTGILYLTGPPTITNNATNNKLFCHFNVIVSNSRHSINILTNVSIYNVPASGKISLYQKKPSPWEDKWKQVYYLGGALRDTFGLLVNVEPVEENGNLTKYLVSLVCPKTHQVLTLDEVQQVFKYGMEDLQIIFRRFQISMKSEPKSTLWKFIYGRPSLSNDVDGDEEEDDEVFLFHDVDTMYLYYAVGMGYILMLEIVLTVLMLIIKRVICYASASWWNDDDDESEEIKCNQLVLLENNDLPTEIKELLCLHLEPSSGNGEECLVNESTC